MSGRSIAQIFALSAALVGFAACSAPNGSTVQANALNGGIIGGDLATGTEDFAKSTVMLVDRKVGALCTATILSDKILITAAHCVVSDASDLVVVFGTDLQATDIILRRVVATETTPLWASRQKEMLNTGDAAVVAFAGGLPAGYKPAKFLTDVSKLSEGQAVMLAGYGETAETGDGSANGAGQLRSVSVQIAKLKFTETDFLKLALASDPAALKGGPGSPLASLPASAATDVSESEILFDQSNGKGACHGDSGGPAYAVVDGETVLVGVTSRGAGACKSAAIYTSIPYYATWMVRTAKALSAQVPAPVTPAPVATVPASQPAAAPVAANNKHSRNRAANPGSPVSAAI